MMSPGTVDDADNPFVPMLIDSLADRVEVLPFSWSGAFRFRYEVLHIHWPERMTKDANALRAMLKSATFVALLSWNRLRKVSNVATVHNLNPHDGTGAFERWVLALWTKSCRARIFLSRTGMDAAPTGNGVLIPHGDYAPFLAKVGWMKETSRRDALLTFGYLRPYKGIEKLMNLISHEGSLRLTVAGKPLSPTYREKLEDLAREASGTVELIPRSLSSEELLRAIGLSEFVILPYTSVYNSGAALLALSAGRPLIVTESPSMRELQCEVGNEWVVTLPEAWDWTHVLSAVRALRADASKRGELPDMHLRNWVGLGAQHAILYESLDFRRNAVGANGGNSDD